MSGPGVALAVAVGAGAGAELRYLADRVLTARMDAAGRDDGPVWATLLVNVVGSLLIGLVAGLGAAARLSPAAHAALATGLAGGLTTFSTWTWQSTLLLAQGRRVAWLLNVGGSLLLGGLAAALGLALT